jgi:hypothetical protein
MPIVARHLDSAQMAYQEVAFLDTESGDAIHLQLAHGFDDQDRELGMDTYCLVRGGLTHYGGPFDLTVGPGRVALTLDDEAARVLELPSLVCSNCRTTSCSR